METHFYSAERADGTMDTTIEEMLASIESAAAPVYEGLLKGMVPVARKARTDFSAFLAAMYLRTPTMRRMSAEMISRHAQIMNYAYATHDGAFDKLVRDMAAAGGPKLDDGLKEEVRQTLMDASGYVLEIPKERTFAVLGSYDKLAALFFQMRWSLAVPLHGFLVTSDNPVVRQADPESWHPIYGDGGFLNKTVRVSLPLSPKLMLLLAWSEGLPEVGALAREQVDGLNRVLASHSDRYLYAHLRHKQISGLAAEYEHVRPRITTQGFGPERFADFRVPRRRSKQGRQGFCSHLMSVDHGSIR